MKISIQELEGGDEVRVTPADNAKEVVPQGAAKVSASELDQDAHLPEEPEAARFGDVGGWASRRQAAPNDWAIYGNTDYGGGKIAATGAGTVAQLVDMTLGGIEQFLTIPRRQAVMLQSMGQGNSDAVTELAREEAGQVFPPEITRPFSTIVERLGGGAKQAYEQNPLGFVASLFGNNVEHGASVVSEATGIKVPVVREALDSLMGLLAGKAVKGGWEQLNEAKKTAFANEFMQRYQRFEQEKKSNSATPEEDAVRVTPEDNAGGEEFTGTPPSPEPVEMTSPKQVAELFKKAKANRLDPDAMTAQEAQQLADMFDRARARRPEDAAAAPPKTRLTEGTVLGEKPAELPPELDSALTKLSRGEAPTLTAEEKIALDDVRKNSPLVDSSGKPLQRGAIDPELVKMLAAFGVGAAVSAPGIFSILKYFRDDEAKKKDEEDWYKGRIYKNFADAAPLALAAGAFGAIKGKGVGRWNPEVFKTLAEPFDRNEAISKWAEKAVPEYITEHAGTKQDPLAKLEVTIDGAKKNWETLWEDGAANKAAINYKDAAWAKDVTPETPIWNLKEGVEAQAIKEAVAKAGKYLEEKVPPEKLTEYDLPRAIKESNEAEPPAPERGSVDPKLLAGLAAIGGGAALDDKNPLRGALLGALTAGLVIRKGKLPADMDRVLGQISTTLRGFDPAVERRARDMVLASGQRLQRSAAAIQPFLDGVGKMTKPIQALVNQALLNGDWETVKRLPGMKAPGEAVQRVLSEYKDTLQGLGRFGEGVSDYFPRLVKDFDGLKQSLNQEALRGLEKTLALAEREMQQKRGRGMSDVERSIVTNRFLFSDGASSFLPGYAKGRKIDYVTPELAKFYETPANSLLRYLSGATFDIEAARFFGRDLKTTAQGKQKFNDIDGSIGNVVDRLREESKLDEAGVKRLTSTLKAFFDNGQKSPDAYLQDIRNLTNLGLLGDVAAAATQLGDPAMVFAYHGFGPTLRGLIQTVKGPEVTIKDLGLSNKIVEELSAERLSGRVLHTVLKPIFSQIDMFGKQLNLSTALIKNRDLARSKSGVAQLERKWGAYFGSDFPALVEDLRNKQLTPRIDSLLFGELSDVQPISMLEMPEAYANNPKLRLAWQMKSWMLKQGDVVRREVVQNLASGDVARMKDGGKMLLKLAAAYAVSNIPADTIKDWMAGRPIHPTDSGKLMENVGQSFGFNRYALDQLTKGDLKGAVAGQVLPPAISMLEPIAKNQPEKLMSYVPIFGREVYARWLGGNERREIAETAAANKGKAKGDRIPLSEAAKEFRRKQREAKRSQL